MKRIDYWLLVTRQTKRYSNLIDKLLPLVKEKLEDYKKLNLPKEDTTWKNIKEVRIYHKIHNRFHHYYRIYKGIHRVF